MKTNTLLLTFFAFLISSKLFSSSVIDVITVVPDENGIVYVNSGSSGDGSSWENAVGELADAMENAKINNDILEIWVTTGTYKPLYYTTLIDDDYYGYDGGKYNFFPVRGNLKIYGGFAGTESSVSERELTEESLSVLSGYMNNGSRNYNIIKCYGTDNFEIDGFIITGAYSTNTTENDDVGAIYLFDSNVTIRNSILTQNQSSAGAGIYATEDSDLLLIHTKLENNVSPYGAGGGLNFQGKNLNIRYCEFINNEANTGGNIIAGASESFSVSNTLIYTDFFNAYGSVTIFNAMDFTNVTIDASILLIGENSDRIVKNSALTRGLGLYQGIGNLPVYYNSYVRFYTQEDENNNLDGYIEQELLFENYNENNFRLSLSSALINKGNNSFNDSPTDLDGNQRIFDGAIDVGAYEYQGAPGLTYVPDNNFEQKLIDLGYDDVLDDHVMTSKIVGVMDLDVSSAGISDLTGIEGFISLKSLNCQDNLLTKLNLSMNLLSLNCSFNQLVSLTVNNHLNILDCSHNLLTELDPGNPAELYCNHNQLTAIELLGTFTKLHCDHNQLTSLNINNWSNQTITEIYAQDNPDLSCIQVDDPAYSEANWTDPEYFLFDEWVNFSNYCDGMSVTDFEAEKISVFPNPVSDVLNINSDEQITKAEIVNLNAQILSVINQVDKTIDVKGLSKGNYILILYFKDRSEKIRFIKN